MDDVCTEQILRRSNMNNLSLIAQHLLSLSSKNYTRDQDMKCDDIGYHDVSSLSLRIKLLNIMIRTSTHT